MPNIYNASWEGYINEVRAGKNGFGYDALFYLPDLKCTAAELSESKKNVISHRGKALELFKLDFMEIMRIYKRLLIVIIVLYPFNKETFLVFFKKNVNLC